jgi:molybdate transport system substrate-binding protein
MLGYRKAANRPKPAAALVAILFLLICAAVYAQQPPPQTKELHVAAAADLQPVLPVLAAAYEHATGIKVVPSFASSATLTEQILNGAPFDLFLSADYVHPEQIVAANLADGKAPTQYAKGTLVLWARKDSPLQPITVDSLTDPRVTSVAIANWTHAPYGTAAITALQRMKVYDKVAPHFVVAENISQAAQFVESGNAQLGLLSLTSASTPHFKEIGTFVPLPNVYNPILQCAVVLSKSPHKPEAHAFLGWLLTPAIQSNLRKYGLDPVK